MKYKYVMNAEINDEFEIEADSEEEAEMLAIERMLHDIMENGTKPFMYVDVNIFDEYE